MLAVIVLLSSGLARAERVFGSRFNTNDNGDIQIIGNTLMTCLQGANAPPATCLASVPVSGTGATGGNLDDNNYAMRLVNTAGGTTSSSSADLSLPAGASVLWAGLYWGADTSGSTGGTAAANPAARNIIRFAAPGSALATVTASQVDAATAAGQPNRYSAFADVTARVQSAGAGTYAVADLQAGTGSDRYAGWSLVVVVRDPSQPLRNLTVFDGYQTISSSATTVNVTVSGFRTPLSGAFTVRAGAVVYEGDLGQTGDQMKLNGVNLGNAVNPTTNVFNSTISRLAVNLSAKNPNFVNQMGFDADVFDASGILANGATSATLTFTTGGETYYPAVLTFANDVYQPIISGNVTKTVTDLSGNNVTPGDVLQYTVALTNTGNDAGVNVMLTDAIPANTTYVPNSLNVATGANAGAKTDVSGDDQAEFGANSTTFRLGAGATAATGGTLAVGAATSVTFRVTVNAGVPAGTVISNQATVTYNGATLGTPFTGLSDGDPNTIGAQPTTVVVGAAQARLSLTKNGTPNPVIAGQNITYTLHLTNSGPGDATNVVVSDPLAASTVFVSASAPAGWTIAAPTVGSNGSVQFSNADVPVGGYDLVIVAQVAPGTAGGTVIGNTATASSGNDATGPHVAATNTLVANSGDLALTKTATAVAGQGQQITYNLQLVNPGPDAATGVVISDPLPAGTTFVSTTAPAGWTVAAPAVGAGGTLTLSNANLPTGTYAFVVVVQVATTVPIGSTLTNTATVTSTSADSNPANNVGTASTLVQNPTPGVTKTFTPASVGSGIASTLRIAITNNAAVPLTGIAIGDTLPTTPGQMRVTNPVSGVVNTCGGTFGATAGATAITLAAAGPLAVGASCYVEVAVVATATGTYTNTTSNITSAQTPSGPTASATLVVAALAAPTTTKSFNPASVQLGGATQMTIAIANPNASAILGAAFTDTYPAGLVNAASGVIASNSCGGTATATAGGNTLQLAGATVPVAGCSVVVNVVATALGSLVNTTSAITSTNAQAGAAATGTLVVTRLGAPTATKSFSPASVALGDAAQMTITLSNASAVAITGAAFNDAYPSGITNAATGVVAGNTCGGTVTAAANGNSLAIAGGVVPANASCSVVANVVATAEGAQLNQTGPITSANAQTGASASGTLTVTPSADLSSVKTGPAAVGAGGAITWTVVVSNAGPSDADGASFSDAMPAGATLVSASCGSTTGGAACGAVSIAANTVAGTITTLPDGGSVTFTITAVAPASGASITNTGTVTPPNGTGDPDPSDNSGSATTALLPPQLTVTKTATPNPFTVGQSATYTITVTNTGSGVTSTPITIADALPSGVTLASASGANWACSGTTSLSCTFAGTLASGASTTLTLDVDVGAAAASANNIAVASGGGDPSCPAATHCTGSVIVPVQTAADIALAKTVDNVTPNVGDTVTFTITASNQGPNDATGVKVTDALPSGLGFIAATPSQGSYDSATGLWSVGALANGAGATLTLTATVLTPGRLSNTATRTGGDQFDPDASNNAASASLNAQPSADVRVSKTVDDAVPNLGSNVTFTITATNAGPDDATGMAITDVLPAGLNVVSATPSQGSYDAASGVWSIGAIANAASATLTVVATVSLPGDITNTASISAAGQYDPNAANNSAGVTINGQSADVQVIKTVDNANPIVGDNVRFTITATNNGPSSATGIAISDALPAGLDLISATPSIGTYDANSGVWSLGSLGASGAGATATLSIVATVTNDGGFTNTATVTAADQPDPNPANNTSSVVVAPIASADLAVIKSGPATAVPGQQVVYTLVVSNAGPSDAAAVVLDDPTPTGLTFVSADAPCNGGFPCALGTLANGASTMVAVTFAVPSGAAAPIGNTASVSSDTLDANPLDNSSSVTTPLTPQANLAALKTGPATVTAEGAISYTVVVSNAGPSDADAASFSDAVPAPIGNVSASCGSAFGGAACGAVAVNGNAVTSTIASLPAGGSVTFTIDGTAPADATSLTNTATVAPPGGVADPDGSDNSSSVDTVVGASADLSVVKTGPAAATPGGSVVYSIAVANAGPSTASAVQLDDPTPAGLVFVSAGAPCAGGFPCALGDIAAGAGVTVSATFAVPPDYVAGAVVNVASVASVTADPDTGNNSSTATSAIAPSADLAVVKSGPAAVTAGAPIAYTIVVSNAGPSDANGATFSDPLPAGIGNPTASCGAASGGAICGVVNVAGNAVTSTITALPAGASLTFTVAGTAPANGTTLVNTATIAPPAGIADPDGADNTSTVTTTVAASADVSILKTAPATVTSGGALRYLLAISNAGPSPADGASYSDTVPAAITAVTASCASASGGAVCATPSVAGNAVSGVVPTLPSGGSVVIEIDGTAPVGATSLSNTAGVVAPNGVTDPNPANNTSTATTAVAAAADIAMTKTVDNAAPVVGDSVTFTVTATNQGPDDATGVSVTDGLPFGLVLVSATPSQGNYAPASGVWAIGALADGASASLVVVATVGEAGPLTNTASVSASDQTDPDPSNNAAGVSLNAGASADLAITKQVDIASPDVGDTVTFTLTLGNNGPDDATGVAVSDPLPAGLTFVAATPSQGSYDAASGVWSIGDVANGASVTLTIAAIVEDAGAITNLATISAENENDPVQGNNQAGAAVNGQLADLQVLKTVDNAAPDVGASVTFTVTAHNNGPDDATGVVISDALPPGLGLVSATPSAGSYDAVSGLWTIGALGASGASSNATLTIVATVADAGALTNTASVSASDQTDPNTTNNSASASLNGSPMADLAIEKTGPTAIAAGDTIVYSIVVTNAGPSAADNVVVSDPTPTGLVFVGNSGACATAYPCALGSLADGASATITSTYSVSADYAGASTIVNTASVASATPDPDNNDNEASASTTVAAGDADVSIVKSGPATASPGGVITYTLTVANAGPATATEVVVDDAIPDGLVLVGASAPCGGGFPCALGDLADGATVQVEVTCAVAANAVGSIVNVASVTSATHDPDIGNNAGSATTSIAVATTSADLAISKQGPATATAAGAIRYTITVSNLGPDAVVDAVVSDPTPAGLTFVAADAPCAAGFPCAIGALASGASIVLSVDYTIADGFGGALSNSASVTSPSVPDPNAANNTSTVTTTVTTGDGGGPGVTQVPVPLDQRGMLMLLALLLMLTGALCTTRRGDRR